MAEPVVCGAEFLPRRIHTATALQSMNWSLLFRTHSEQIDHTMWAECSVSNVTVGGPHSYHRPLTYRASTEAQFAFIQHIDPACQYEPNCLFLAHTKHKHGQKKRKRNADFFFPN